MQPDDMTDAITTGVTTIVIVDDHPLFRGALAQALTGGGQDFRIREAGDYAALLALLETDDSTDLVLLDLTMPNVSGFAGLMGLRALHSSLPVVIVSATDDATTIRRALDLGASGFVPKSSTIETMREAVGAVLSGDIWVPPHVETGEETDADIALLLSQLDTLTPQQTRVLAMLGQGLLNKQIAYELDVSEATVKAHVSAVLSKLNVDSRTQAVIRLNTLGADILPPALT